MTLFSRLRRVPFVRETREIEPVRFTSPTQTCACAPHVASPKPPQQLVKLASPVRESLAHRYFSMVPVNVDLGTAPITVSSFWPSLKIITVGMERMPYSVATEGLSSVFSLTYRIKGGGRGVIAGSDTSSRKKQRKTERVTSSEPDKLQRVTPAATARGGFLANFLGARRARTRRARGVMRLHVDRRHAWARARARETCTLQRAGCRGIPAKNARELHVPP